MSLFSELYYKRTFDYPYEAKHVEEQIKKLIKSGDVREIPVEVEEGIGSKESWYQDIETGEIYRYCAPNFPARGIWEKVR